MVVKAGAANGDRDRSDVLLDLSDHARHRIGVGDVSVDGHPADVVRQDDGLLRLFQVIDDHPVSPLSQLENGCPTDAGRSSGYQSHVGGHDTCPDSTDSTAGTALAGRGNSASRMATRWSTVRLTSISPLASDDPSGDDSDPLASTWFGRWGARRRAGDASARPDRSGRSGPRWDRDTSTATSR